MTREEFNDVVMKCYDEFEEKELLKSKQQIFNNAYEISKMIAIKDYLTETDDEEAIKPLYVFANTILTELYEYEWNYDEPMWNTWDNISYLITDFISEIKRRKKS